MEGETSMIYLQLFYEFFCVGLFAIGGGLATIPFLYDLIDKYHWFNEQMLTNMIAISEATPGAIGINMATYVGIEASGSILGGISTTLALITPSIIIIIIIAHFLEQFKGNKYVDYIFYGLRACVCGLIIVATISIFKAAFYFEQSFHLLHILIFIIALIITTKFKKITPIQILITGAILGLVLQL